LFVLLLLARGSGYRPNNRGRIFISRVSSNLEWQVSSQLSGLSQDGGASVLLNGRLVWLFDDTEVTPRMMS
jgi:hypothetical protein